MSSGSRRGFTLLEAMIVVAILAIGLAIAAFSIQSSRESVSLERATAQARSAIEDARSLASIVGARAGTGRLVPGAGCGYWTMNPPQVELLITPGAGTIDYPARIVGVDAAGNMTLECQQWRLANVAQPGSNPTFVAPLANTSFAFTSSGRMIGPGAPILVRITSPTQPTINGFRILNSGVICQSSAPAPPAGFECDESPNW
jgi:prepilin-type N-terminal cleavage/methylation domain-containing protein